MQVVLIVLAGIFFDRISHPLNWVGIAFFFVATFLYSYLALTKQHDASPSQAAAYRGICTPAAGAAGSQPSDLRPQRTVTWSHKGIAASASTAQETTPLRRSSDPPQTPWYASGGRAAKKGKGAVVRPGGVS